MLLRPQCTAATAGREQPLGGICSLSPPSVLGEPGGQQLGLVSEVTDGYGGVSGATGRNALLPGQSSVSACSPPGSFLEFSPLHLPS